MSKIDKRAGIVGAISSLARHIKNGELLAASGPAMFLRCVEDELVKFRKERDEARTIAEEMHKDITKYWHKNVNPHSELIPLPWNRSPFADPGEPLATPEDDGSGSVRG